MPFIPSFALRLQIILLLSKPFCLSFFYDGTESGYFTTQRAVPLSEKDPIEVSYNPGESLNEEGIHAAYAKEIYGEGREYDGEEFKELWDDSEMEQSEPMIYVIDTSSKNQTVAYEEVLHPEERMEMNDMTELTLGRSSDDASNQEDAENVEDEKATELAERRKASEDKLQEEAELQFWENVADREMEDYAVRETELAMDVIKKDPLDFLLKGSLLNGGLSYSEAGLFLKWLCSTFDDMLKEFRIGTSLDGEPIFAYRLGVSSSDNAESTEEAVGHNNMTEPTNILLTSLIHARESLSLTTLLYFMTKLLMDHGNRDFESSYLLHHSTIWVIPIVNPDGYKAISETKNYSIRKNRRGTCNEADEKSERNGVDLNRNFDIAFESMHYSACDEEYAGAYPFSEPETIAIKKIVEEYENHSLGLGLYSPFKFILHLHSYGNIWAHPYNCCPDKKLDPFPASIMEELASSFDVQFGSSSSLLDYTASGEASDWALEQHGILSLSPEVGEDTSSLGEDNEFWPPVQIRRDAHVSNLPRIKAVIIKAGKQFDVGIRKYTREEVLQDTNTPFVEQEESREKSFKPSLPTYVKQAFIEQCNQTGFSCSIYRFVIRNIGLGNAHELAITASVDIIIDEHPLTRPSEKATLPSLQFIDHPGKNNVKTPLGSLVLGNLSARNGGSPKVQRKIFYAMLFREPQLSMDKEVLNVCAQEGGQSATHSSLKTCYCATLEAPAPLRTMKRYPYTLKPQDALLNPLCTHNASNIEKQNLFLEATTDIISVGFLHGSYQILLWMGCAQFLLLFIFIGIRLLRERSMQTSNCLKHTGQLCSKTYASAQNNFRLFCCCFAMFFRRNSSGALKSLKYVDDSGHLSKEDSNDITLQELRLLVHS